jgi:hypothetical protein
MEIRQIDFNTPPNTVNNGLGGILLIKIKIKNKINTIFFKKHKIVNLNFKKYKITKNETIYFNYFNGAPIFINGADRLNYYQYQ